MIACNEKKDIYEFVQYWQTTNHALLIVLLSDTHGWNHVFKTRNKILVIVNRKSCFQNTISQNFFFQNTTNAYGAIIISNND